MERFNLPPLILYAFYLNPAIYLWQYNTLQSSAEAVIDYYDLKTLIFFNEHFNVTLINGLNDFLNLDPFIKQAYIKLGLTRQKELQDLEYNRNRKEKEVREQMEGKIGNREVFDKLAHFHK